MFSLRTRTATIALAAGLSLTLAACASDDSTETTGGSSESAAPEAEASPTPAAEIPSLTGVQTAVTLDPSFVMGLQSLMLTPGVVAGAALDAATGKIAFPITGGNVTYFDPASGVEPFVQGEILHEGAGLSLTGGGKTVKLEDFVVDPAESVLTGKVTVDGKVFGENVELFFLDGRTLKPLAADVAAGTATLEGTTVSLTKGAADALNMVFGENVELFFLDGSTLQPLAADMAAGTATLQGTTVSLTKGAADALNMVFGVTALTEFFPVGVATIVVELPKS